MRESWRAAGFFYGTGANGTTGDNGNVQQQNVIVPGQATITQTYGYDGVNRLSAFSETGNSANQNYSYDQFGNRWIASGWIPYAGQTPTSGTAFTNNQWLPVSGGLTYDAAGNQTSIATPPRSFTHDAENRQTSALINNYPTVYAYDGDGRRVIKISCPVNTPLASCTAAAAGATVTTFVYDAAGQLAAEYGGPASPNSGTTYLTADHLGPTRLVTNASGAAVSRYDCAPFGEELTAGIDGRLAPYSTNQYPTATPDGVSQKFTDKERDAETGLDFFGARYSSSAQGRFTTPDWSAKPEPVPYADLANPQSLNLYNYMRNNPPSGIDPDGHCCWDALQQWMKDNPRTTQTAQGVGKIAVGVGLVATAAVGDVPGSAAGALLIVNAALGGTTTAVSGVLDVTGAATNTNVEQGQKALDAVSNLPALVTTATTGNLNTGAAVGTLADAAKLGAKPSEALKNPATIAEAIKTLSSAAELGKSAASSVASTVRGAVAQTPAGPPAPPPPPPPPTCRAGGSCK